MKIIKILSTVMFSILLFSCGGKSTDKEGKTTDEKIEDAIADCNCSELTGKSMSKIGDTITIVKEVIKKGDKELYSGICVTKDQYDTIIGKNTYRNGWLINKIVKQKIGSEYVKTQDINYENGYQSTYINVIIDDSGLDFPPYVTEYYAKGNKEKITSYRVNISNREGLFELRVMENDSQQKPASMPNALPEFEAGWSLKKLSEDELYKILGDLKKELPHFNYWKK